MSLPSPSHFAAHIRDQYQGFKLKRKAMNPKANPSADGKLRIWYAKRGKIVDAFHVRAGVYVSRNPPWLGDESKAAREYRALLKPVADELRRRPNGERMARSAEALGAGAAVRPAQVPDGVSHGRSLRALNLDFQRVCGQVRIGKDRSSGAA